ncbi:Membrane protein implicated in regulation of membrane protease activity [Elusimicrobium minutum Pei191]|uniref:Membrane protein implicated in regulation of membrane protease activity n=1 Tax=Elusimicrobium minutum (strain Pei191) TaxID=445932 RepID=B2KB97_ELUMP|nr:NfeD family protein [Elusimicrobium minutum]ACC97919.1 Membrane protein implicated in regulation of membrane protease activity [Elusimicrobium minutum Pei191]
MSIHYIWLIAGLLFIIGEMFTLDFSLACIGTALLVTALPAYFGASFLIQAVFFAVIAIILFLTVRPIALKYLHKNQSVKTNVDALIGKQAHVTEEINAEKKTGRVKIDGDVWQAVSDSVIALDADVTVEKIEGIILTVKKI